jgi:hypothetical protein
MMEGYAEDAVNAARANYGVELDYSPESIPFVEEVLEKV